MIPSEALMTPEPKPDLTLITSPREMPMSVWQAFSMQIKPDGTAIFTHLSGSTITFAANGTISAKAAKDLSLDYGEFLLVQTTEAQKLAWIQQQLLRTLYAALHLKLQTGDPNALRCSHR